MPDNMFFTSETNLTVFAPPVNPQVFVYDANGNVTDDGLQTYTWDDENRLTAAETSTNLVGAARRRSEFVYDHQWRRVRRRDLTDWSAGGYHATNSTRFVYDGWNVVQEIVDTPTLPSSVTNYFTWGHDLSGTLQGAGGIGGLLCRVSSSGAQPVLLYCYDGNGNVVNLADAGGSVVAGYTYDPFGRTVGMSGPAAAANAYRFSTKPVEDAFGLYYYGYRYYSPGVGRWMSRDPIGEKASRNLYSPMANAPVLWVDALGMQSDNWQGPPRPGWPFPPDYDYEYPAKGFGEPNLDSDRGGGGGGGNCEPKCSNPDGYLGQKKNKKTLQEPCWETKGTLPSITITMGTKTVETWRECVSDWHLTTPMWRAKWASKRRELCCTIH